MLYQKKTREKVRAAAAALGYRRNPAAASLRTGRSLWVGVMIEGVEDESNAWTWATFELSMLCGVQKTLSDNGYFTVLGSKFGAESDEESLDLLVSSGIGGLILRRPPEAVVERAQALIQEGIPTIAVFPACKDDLYPNSVDMDNKKAGRMAGDLFLKASKKYPLCIIGSKRQTADFDRAEGFSEVFETAWDSKPPTCELHTYAIADNLARITKAFQEHKPDAVLCTDAGSAFVTSIVAERLDLNVPDDVSIIGFDCYSFRAARQQRITSLGASWWEAGQVAADGILDMITNGTKWSEPKMLEPRFVMGHTTPAEFAEGVALPWTI